MGEGGRPAARAGLVQSMFQGSGMYRWMGYQWSPQSPHAAFFVPCCHCRGLAAGKVGDEWVLVRWHSFGEGVVLFSPPVLCPMPLTRFASPLPRPCGPGGSRRPTWGAGCDLPNKDRPWCSRLTPSRRPLLCGAPWSVALTQSNGHRHLLRGWGRAQSHGSTAAGQIARPSRTGRGPPHTTMH